MTERREEKQANVVLTFRELFRARLDATGISHQNVADYLGKPYTRRTISNYCNGRVSVEREGLVQPLLEQWMKTPDAQIKKGQAPKRKKPKRKKTASKYNPNRCPHCQFTHQNQKIVDKYIYDSHGLYPYICSICRAKHIRHDSFLQHMRKH